MDSNKGVGSLSKLHFFFLAGLLSYHGQRESPLIFDEVLGVWGAV
jgi:hypothetical protein